MPGIALAQYQGWADTEAVDETRMLDDTTVFDENADISEMLNYIFNTTSTANYFELVGSWESEPIDLNKIGRIKDSYIHWVANVPSSCIIAVHTSLFDGAWWQPWQLIPMDYYQIPGLTLFQDGRDVTGCKLRVKVEFYSSDVTKTPNLTELVVRINSRKIFRIMPDGKIKACGTITQNASETI